MCGVIGIVAKNPVAQEIYDGLTVLQHRGQDAAGIVTAHNGRLALRKNNGLVRDVFHSRHMVNLLGNMGIGHVRYPTAGSSSSAEAQPFYVNSPYGITLAHNGNLTNARALKEDLFREDLRHINTDSDSEILLNVFAHELQHQGRLTIDENDVFAAIERVHQRSRGGYAAVAMICGYGIVGFRDPHGIRPIVFGKRETDRGDEFIIASESVALDVLGFQLIRDLAPGEAVFISESGEVHTRQCAQNPMYAPCIFEYVYLARPDSIMDDVSVHKARLRMGEALAEKVLNEWRSHDIDVIIPVPDTSRTSAIQMSYRLGVVYREGFIKNRYIGRTFIMPGQKLRKKSVRQKLNAIDLEFKGKNVLLVDDSIVRGTTSEQIVQMARDAGARKVYFASAAPAVRYPNVYGIDMPSSEELVAFGRDEDQVAKEIGADRLVYQDLEHLVTSVQRGNANLQHFDTSVFSGEYITGDIDKAYLNSLAAARNDEQKAKLRSNDNTVVGLPNSE